MARKRKKLNHDVQTEKKQKNHLMEFGEIHPINDEFNGKFTESKFEQEDEKNFQSLNKDTSALNEDFVESENDEPSSFSQFLSAFKKPSVEEFFIKEDEQSSESQGKSDSECESEINDKEKESEIDDSDDDDLSETELNDQNILDGTDYFSKHFEVDIEEDFVKKMNESTHQIKECQNHWKCLDKFQVFSHNTVDDLQCRSLNDMHIKKSLLDNIKLHQLLKISNDSIKLTDFQAELMTVIGKYYDLFYPNRTFQNGEDIRLMYTLHSVNHILKTRSKIVHHNSKLSKAGRNSNAEYRDQGLTRPKVLIVVPFRESALRIVKLIESLLISDDKANIQNKKRFKDEFNSDKDEETRFKKKKISKPEDYEAMFSGNIDDSFRIGLAITKKSLRLYADFYSSDIIIASPLGLRTIIGAEGEKDRDFDFLSSIEILIMDQMEVFTMQNWDHVLHLMAYLHQQPKQSHGLDFSRVRMWCLNGWSKYYRQTLLFSGVVLPQINSLFNNHCLNYDAKVKVSRPNLGGSIDRVITQVPHIFHRFETRSVAEAIEERFSYFVNKLLPQFKDAVMSHTLVFIPSYFDFIRIRNYMKKENMSITQICEYTKNAKISRARNLFFHSKRHFLLYTERFHFYRRYHVKGIRHIIFYELPTSPHFYSELCNFLNTNNADNTEVSCTVMYNKYDAYQLAEVVGTERATVMLNSSKKSHMFVTGD